MGKSKVEATKDEALAIVSSLKFEHEIKLKVAKKLADLKVVKEQSLRVIVEAKVSVLERKVESLEA